LGHYGVLIFFVHTSLVLMMSMKRGGLQGRNLFLSFYTRRFFRIYPLSIVCILAVVAFQVPPAPWLKFQPLSASAIWSNLGLVMNLTLAPAALGPLWSLPYEIDMYLVLPLLFLLVTAVRCSRGVLYLGSLALAASYWLILNPRLDFLVYLPSFVAGAVAFVGIETVRPRYSGSWWVVCILGGAVAYGALHLIGLRTGVPDAPARMIVTGGLGFALPLFRQLPAMKWAHLTAKYSYGIYLFHMIAIWCGFSLLGSYPLVVRIGVFAAMTIAIPIAMFFLIEDPFIRLGKRLVDYLGMDKKSKSLLV
jgi:peptidoglycan/LPS O-acetylase OafA/YrhL